MLEITHEFTKELLGVDVIENKIHVYNRNTDPMDMYIMCDDINPKSYERDDDKKSLILVYSDYFVVTKDGDRLDAKTRSLPMFITYGEMTDRVCETYKDTHKLIMVVIDAVWASPKEMDEIHERYDIPVLAFLESPENQ